MTEVSLVEILNSTQSTIDDLALRAREGHASTEISKRVALLRRHQRQLDQSLRELRSAATLLDLAGGDGHSIWTNTRIELAKRAPPQIHDPATALVANSLELLQLVSYVAAASAIAHERRTLLIEKLAAISHKPVSMSQFEELVTRLARSGATPAAADLHAIIGTCVEREL